MKVQGFLLTQAGWGGAGQGEGLGRRWGSTRNVSCEVGWGVDGSGRVMSSRGRWAGEADSLRRDAGEGGRTGDPTDDDGSLPSSHQALRD